MSHIISLAFLQKHSFWATSPRLSDERTSFLVSIEKAEPDEILRESFQARDTEGVERPSLQPRTENLKISSLPPILQPSKAPLPIISLSIPDISLKNEIVSDPHQSSFIMLPPIEHLNLFEHLPKDLISLTTSLSNGIKNAVPSFLSANPTTFPSPECASSSKTPALRPEIPSFENPRLLRAESPPQEDEVVFSPSLLTSVFHEASTPPSQIFTPKPFSHLPNFPSLKDLSTASYSDFFDTEIVVSPLENDEGYVFALTLVPQPGLDLPKIRQHYSFLIDKSNSIQKDRLVAVKQAVLKALEELDLEDSFNIIAFDNKIEKMSSAPLPATSSSLIAARNFLEKIHLGSFFSSSNLSKPLLLTIPPSQDDGIHTAILFSDGEPLSKKIAQRELALEWTAYNNGRVSLFAIGVGGDPHLATLDATTAFNRGKILYPPTKRGIKRKLLKLIKTIGLPVAKDITATAINRSSQANITLYPQQKQMPALYLNEPYVILGTTDKLENFILFVQGRLKNKWLNIKKNISFINAKKGEASLRAEWALHQAYSLYEKYLYNLDPAYLVEARDLLEPHDLSVAFQ